MTPKLLNTWRLNKDETIFLGSLQSETLKKCLQLVLVLLIFPLAPPYHGCAYQLFLFNLHLLPLCISEIKADAAP